MGSTLIEVTGYDGKPLYIARDKIMAVSDADEVKHGSPVAMLVLATVAGSEEWFVRETVDAVRVKYDNSGD